MSEVPTKRTRLGSYSLLVEGDDPLQQGAERIRIALVLFGVASAIGVSHPQLTVRECRKSGNAMSSGTGTGGGGGERSPGRVGWCGARRVDAARGRWVVANDAEVRLLEALRGERVANAVGSFQL